MIVCSCNIISKRDIENTIIELLKEDPWRLIVPGVVYQTMNERGKCCGCFPGVVDIIVKTTQKFHEQQQTPSADIINFMEGKTAARPAGQVASSGAAVSASAVALPPLTGTSDRDQVKKISGMKKAMTKTMT